MSKKFFSLILTSSVLGLSTPISNANQEQLVKSLETRITVLEKELDRLRKQEERVSKYSKCVQRVKGNALVVPFKMLNCIRK